MNKTLLLKVKEIYYSLQGEGGRSGEASIFIRLAGCNMSCSFCDTDFTGGEDMRLPDILGKINKYPCKWIVWTGGEPTLQLNDDIVAYFKAAGFKQAIETNGSNVTPLDLDYIACSPKVDVKTLESSFLFRCVDEFRYPIGRDMEQSIPLISDLPHAIHYFLSPLFIGIPHEKLYTDKGNIQYAIDTIKRYPEWKLSIQIHKLINIK